MGTIEFESAFERGEEGFSVLVIKTIEDFLCDRGMLVLGEFPIRELCAHSGDDFDAIAEKAGVSVDDFSSPAARFVLANGWQSWSFAGELYKNERPRRAFVKTALNSFVDHPAEGEIRALARHGLFRPDIVSHFFTVLRVDTARLALVSANVEPPGGGTAGMARELAGNPAPAVSHAASAQESGLRYLPPVTFLIGPSSVRIAVFAEGGSFRKGETVARVAILAGEGYFDIKKKMALLFGSRGRFEHLRFMVGTPSGSPQPSIPQPDARETPLRSAPIGGFETWYNHYLDIDETILLKDLDSIGSNDNLINAMFISPKKPVVFQIDDGWERQVGDWRPHERKFPHGVAHLSEAIERRGYIPGIWVAPFLVMPASPVAVEHPGWLLADEGGNPVKAGWNSHWGGDVYCLDLSLPEVEDYLVSLFDTIIHEWGYRYLKLDFLYAGMLRGMHKGTKGGHWEHYIRILHRLTSTRSTKNGLPVAFLACGSPFESTAPFIPLMRIGADTLERWDWLLLKLIGHQGRPSAMVNVGHTLARSYLDRTLLLNDPDVVFCRTHRTSLKDNEKFLIGLVAKMFASQIMFADDPAEFAGPGRPAAGGSLSEAAFTRELLELYAKVGNREFGVERFSAASPNLYRIFSSDGMIYGIINLSARSQALLVESPSGDQKPTLAPAHSILFFGLP